MIGLLGAQRVGKSTLAKAFAQRCDIPFLQTDARGVYAACGMDPRKEYPIEERLAVQNTLLESFEKQFAAATKVSRLFISDRTPLDGAAYLLADVQRSTLAGSPEVAQLVVDYVGRCIQAANRWFSTIVVVQPGIPLVEEEGKAPACPAFMEHYNALAIGLVMDERMECRHYRLPRAYLDLSDRVSAVIHAAHCSISEHLALMEAAKAAGAVTLQ
jgi:hypothetical protein